MNYEDLIRRINIDDKDILNVYQYGSRVYGTNRSHSDWDFIIITNRKQEDQFSDNLINVTYFTATEFQSKLDNHEITALECYFIDQKHIWKEQVKFNFKLNLSQLRHSLSAKSSNSWVKAKKKLTVEKDYDLDIGKKSLFHSMRIIHYGIQIAKYKKIFEYDACNVLFLEIMNSYNNWDKLFENYKTEYNELMTEFRLVAPK